MPPRLLLAAVLYWLLLLAAAIGLGAGRDMVVAPILGDRLARPLETILLCAVIAALAVVFAKRHTEAAKEDLRLVGLLWTALTVAFEFLAGHYLLGIPWAWLLADWNLAAGHLWPLVPATALLAPVIAGRRR